MSRALAVSLAALHWATYEPRAGDVPTTALRVLHVLADYAGTDGQAWPSHATIARRLGVSVSTVQRALRALRGCGLIAKGSQAAAASVRGDRRPVVYRLDLPPDYSTRRGPDSRPVSMVTGRTGGHHGDRASGSRVVTMVTGTGSQHGDRQTVREPDSLESGSLLTYRACARCRTHHAPAADCPQLGPPPGGSLRALVAEAVAEPTDLAAGDQS